MIKVNGVEIKQNNFPDHTLLMKFDPNGDDFSYDRGAIKIEWLYENDAELFSLICVKKHLDRHFTNPQAVLIMPYIPHARMDRVKNDEDVFTLKYFCEVINSLKFDVVWVRDAHSNVSLALLENVVDEGVVRYVRDAINKSGAEALFFPDEGAMKRYADLFKDMPYAFGMKKRDWKTGQIQGLDLINTENIVDKNVLIVDDICSRGGTFYHAAKALKAAGAKSVSLYVTHLEKTVILGEMASTDGLVDHIYTTKSIFPEELFNDGYDPHWKEWITVMK
jgi:ribose-phosphate pyrophosphokinase